MSINTLETEEYVSTSIEGVYVPSIDLTPYNFTVELEDEISWKKQNRIHKILNIAFKNISTSFLAKTYGYTRPTKRVLGWVDGEIVAHMGILYDKLMLQDGFCEVGCIGLWASVAKTKGWAGAILERSMQAVNHDGYKLAIGMTSSPTVIEHILPEFGDRVRMLDLRIEGIQHTSKLNTFATVLNIGHTAEEFNNIIHFLETQQKLEIQGEPF